MLSKDQIRGAADRRREFIAVPEWTPAGETFDPTKHGVYVGTMTGRERDAWEGVTFRKKTENESENEKNFRSLLLVYTVQDENGGRLFDMTDLDWLADKSSVAVDPLFDAAMRINRLRKEDHDELVKN